MRYSGLSVAGLIACLLPSLVWADVTLPAIFGSHMVVQRDLPLPVWGWANAGEQVTVTADKVTATTRADATGKWRVTLPKLVGSLTPITLTVAGRNTLTLVDVLVGDVWVCAGQSNMEFGLSDVTPPATEAQLNHDDVRFFVVAKRGAFTPQTDCQGTWVVCSLAKAQKFSAVGCYFGLDIHATSTLPVGLIGVYWGGTTAQAWTSRTALAAQAETLDFAIEVDQLVASLPQQAAVYEQELVSYQIESAKYQREVAQPYQKAMQQWRSAAARARTDQQSAPARPRAPTIRPPRPARPPATPDTRPTTLFNGMLAPIIPFGIKGAIWYQGEANADHPKQYQVLLPAMITDWRTHWGQQDFAFCFVQLANYMARHDEAPTDTNWARLREAQAMTLRLPNTSMATIIDIGDASNIHPTDKLDVGQRLARGARCVAYDELLVASGPVVLTVKYAAGTAIVSFTADGGRLTISTRPAIYAGDNPAAPADRLVGFAVAGADRQFVWATATIVGDTVVMTSDAVKDPVAVRYGWGDNPQVNLYNQEGLPASPFRTDTWPLPPPPLAPAAVAQVPER